MKRAFVLSFFLGLALLLALPAFAETGNLRYTISVAKFDNSAGWHGQWHLGDAWGAVMTERLQQTGKFVVLGESDMRDEALREQDFAASGRTASGSKAPAMGQMTPAQLLVKGDITHVQQKTRGGSGGIRIKKIRIGGKKASAEVNATIYVVNTTTGQVLASTRVTGKSSATGGSIDYYDRDFGTGFDAFKKDNVGRAVEDAVAEAVKFISEQLPEIPWTGSVVRVKGDQVYINRGSREGVASGQTFVVGEADVIRDPDTGEILDESLAVVARIKADTVKEKLTICSLLSGEASAVSAGLAIHPAP